MNLAAVEHRHIGYEMQNNNTALRITSDDIKHMHAFAANRKHYVLETIMSRTPATGSAIKGHNHYEKTIWKLRKSGFRLIDLQPQEFILTSVWYKNVQSMIGLHRVEVAMLLWVVEEEMTNLTTWRI